MNKVHKGTAFYRAHWRLLAGGALVCMVLLVGCPTAVGPTTNTNANANDNTADRTLDDITGEILSFRTNASVSRLGGPVSVIYNVGGSPDTLQGYYVPVADGSEGAGEIGEEVRLATGLAVGEVSSFSFDPMEAGIGYYRVGVIATLGDEEKRFSSTGVIIVQGSPDPMFILPSAEVTLVAEGDDVQISFDARDPDGDVHWRLFYLTASDSRDESADDIGTQLATGQGNVGSYTFSTNGLIPGDYELGLATTDSGSTIVATVADGNQDQIVMIPSESVSGPILRVVEQTEARPPTLTFLAPGADDEELFGSQAFTLQFVGEINEVGATGFIDLFVDTDRNVSNGTSTPFAEGLDPDTTTFPLPTDLVEGTYYIGATIRDDINDPVTVYATGAVIVVREVTVEVTEPNTHLPIAPSTTTETSEIDIVWTTNAPSGAGVVDVFARAVDENGGEYGAEIPILTAVSLTTTSAEFSSTTSGRYLITVRVEMNDGTVVSDSAPQPIRVSSLPAVLWVGSLADDTDTTPDGAIFEGHNFEDNAGCVFASAGDMNGDGEDEFIIGARYGKPAFQNDSGIGPGEAYVILGASGSNKLRGSYELNSVGTSLLEGVTLTGIPTVGNSEDTDGLVEIKQIPDADGDSLGEIAFGFPWVDSSGQYALEADGQFLRGGVVILSSKNTTAWSSSSTTRVIDLADVGQIFDNMDPAPAEVEATLVDELAFDQQEGACADGTDGVLDTIIGPGIGFIELLAPPMWEQLGFVPYPPTVAQGPGVCPTQYEDTDCVNAGVNADPFYPGEHGSGFYVDEDDQGDENEPQPPYGARILGISEDDKFGTSIAFNTNSLGTDNPGDLIITAPERTATGLEFDPTALGADIPNAGVGFLMRNRLLWDKDSEFGYDLVPPFPHQYMVSVDSHCGDFRAPNVGQLAIAGGLSDKIETILGLDDFNGDGRADFAVGAPNADSGKGRVYVTYRRDIDIEGDFVLNRIGLAPSDPERLAGMMLTTKYLDGLGSSLATGLDFNGDGVGDLVIGSPTASNGVGEVVIVFGGTGYVTGLEGTDVDDMLGGRTADTGAAVAARITGNPLDTDGNFGFNIANAGDLNGDGMDDLVVAAPNATPRFDPDPTDAVDELTSEGLDLDFDGYQDDVTGAIGIPDGTIDDNDNLLNAGIVYVIYGSNRLDLLSTSDKTISIEDLGGNSLRGFMIVGRYGGDRLGGGDAGDEAMGGIADKRNRGRSRGVAAAGDVDGDGRADLLIGSILADPRIDPVTQQGTQNAGEAYLIYGTVAP